MKKSTGRFYSPQTSQNDTRHVESTKTGDSHQAHSTPIRPSTAYVTWDQQTLVTVVSVKYVGCFVGQWALNTKLESTS